MASGEEGALVLVPDVHWIESIPYPGVLPAHVIHKIPDLQVYQDDVYVTGYSKSGNIWVMVTIEAILRADELDDIKRDGMKSNFALLESQKGYDNHQTWQRPRIIHSHMRYHMLPKGIQEKKVKVVHIMRNPRDVAVSYYKMAQINEAFGYYTGSWEAFFEAFISGKVAFGTWFDYVTDWLKYKDEPNILFITYEDFIEDHHGMIKQLAKFLGKSLDDETTKQIAELVKFKNIKTIPKMTERPKGSKGEFFRKGVVGDWVNYFTPEQEARMEEIYQNFKIKTGMELKFK